jgi:hypothetical protein
VPLITASIFALILVVLCVAACFALRGARKIREPVCAHCRYPTADITRLMCPECGNDLRAVGILTPRIRARMAGSFLGVVVGWTLVMALITMLSGTLAMNLGAQWRSTSHHATFHPVVPIASRAMTIVEVNEQFVAPDSKSAIGPNIPASPGAEYRTAGTLTVDDSASGARAVAELRRAGVDFGDGVTPFAQIDAALVDGWLASAGVAGASVPQIDAFVTALRFAEVGSVIESLEGQAIFTRSGTGYGTISTSRRGPFIAASIAVVISVVWILGIVRLARMMRIPARRDGGRVAVVDQPASST